MSIGHGPIDGFGNPFAVDFTAQITAGKIALSGNIANLYDVGLQRDVQRAILPELDSDYLNIFISPPIVGYVYAPFALLPYIPAALIWTCFSIGFFLVGLRLFWPLAGSLRAHGFRRLAIVAFSVPPVVECIQSGQDATLSFLILAAGLRLHSARRDGLAGIVLGLGMYKPQLFLLFGVYFISRRRWLSVAGFAAAGSTLALASVALIGLDGIPIYLRLLTSDLYVRGIAEPLNWNMQSLVAIVLSCSPRHLRLVIYGTFLMLGSLAAWFCCRSHSTDWLRQREHDARLFAGTILATALIDPHFFLYDCTILVLPALVLLAESRVAALTRTMVAAIYILTLFAPVLHKAAAFPVPLNVIDTQWSVAPIAVLLVIAWRKPRLTTPATHAMMRSRELPKNAALSTCPQHQPTNN
jgi:hypothetical protein